MTETIATAFLAEDPMTDDQIDVRVAQVRKLADLLNNRLDQLAKVNIRAVSVVGDLDNPNNQRFAPHDFSRVRLVLEFPHVKGE